MDLSRFKKILSGRKIIKKMATPGKNLSSRAARGTFWAFIIRAADRLSRLIKVIVLARILSPDDFGVFGIALLVLAILDSFSKTGYSQALIQKKENVRSYFDTAWTVGVVRAAVIAIIVVLLAEPAASLFKAPGVEHILRVIGISIVIQSLNNIAVIYFHRELVFHKLFKYIFIGTAVDFIVTITAAYLLRSVWALVLGLLAGTLTTCIMSYVIEPYRPRFRFVRSQARELFGFGKWVLGSSILIFLITQGDDILVGSLLGATMLGFYQMAYRISNTPTTEAAHMVSMVSFPLYSKLQDNISRLKDAYLKILQLVAFFSFPIAGLIFILAPEFTELFLGEEWMPATPVIRALVLAGATRSIILTTLPLFRAIGKPKIETKWQVIRLVILVILIYPLSIKYGIMGTAISVLASAFISNIGFCFEVIRIIKCGIRNFGKLVILPLINAVVISLCIYALKFYIDAANFLGFFALVGISIIIFFGINYLFDRYLNYGIRLLIKEGLHSLIK